MVAKNPDIQKNTSTAHNAEETSTVAPPDSIKSYAYAKLLIKKILIKNSWPKTTHTIIINRSPLRQLNYACVVSPV